MVSNSCIGIKVCEGSWLPVFIRYFIGRRDQAHPRREMRHISLPRPADLRPHRRESLRSEERPIWRHLLSNRCVWFYLDEIRGGRGELDSNWGSIRYAFFIAKSIMDILFITCMYVVISIIPALLWLCTGTYYLVFSESHTCGYFDTLFLLYFPWAISSMSWGSSTWSTGAEHGGATRC